MTPAESSGNRRPVAYAKFRLQAAGFRLHMPSSDSKGLGYGSRGPSFGCKTAGFRLQGGRVSEIGERKFKQSKATFEGGV